MSTVSSVATAALNANREEIERAYGGMVGGPAGELVTPALVLDVDAAQRNIEHMSAALDEIGNARIRPHIKVHTSPALARRQVQAGAIGLSVATVWEAMAMAEAVLDHLFIVNQVAGPAKVRAVAGLARESDIMVAGLHDLAPDGRGYL